MPLGFTLVAAVRFFGMILNDQLLRAARVADPDGPGARASVQRLRSLLVLPTDYGLLCLVFVLLGAPALFLGAYTLLLAGSAGYLALASVKWFRVMRGLDRRPLNGAGTSRADRPTDRQETS